MSVKSWDTTTVQKSEKKKEYTQKKDKNSQKGMMTTRRLQYHRDFPGAAVVENPPANAGDMGSSPGPGRSHTPQSN